MELLALYILGVINLALLWHLHTIHEEMSYERENAKEERENNSKILLDAFTATAKERKDLYDRLQAGTLPSYKEHVEAPNEVVEDKPEEIVDLEEAKEEIMNG